MTKQKEKHFGTKGDKMSLELALTLLGLMLMTVGSIFYIIAMSVSYTHLRAHET